MFPKKVLLQPSDHEQPRGTRPARSEIAHEDIRPVRVCIGCGQPRRHQDLHRDLPPERDQRNFFMYMLATTAYF